MRILMSTRLNIALAVTLLLTTSMAAGRSNPGPRTFGIDQKTYFNLLDYDVPNVSKQIPKYENDLLTLCDQITGGIENAKFVDPSKVSPQAAMTLGYTAFYIGNTDYGAYYGKISHQELTRYRRFAPSGSTLLEELAAREQVAYAIGNLAKKAAPQEEVLHGITSAANFRYDIFKYGKPSQETIEELISTTEAFPSFNIFASWNVLQLDDTQLTDQQEARLFKLYKERVELRDPCHRPGKKSRVCDPPNREYVAHLLKEAGIFEGDVYLRHALRLLDKDPTDAEAWDLIWEARKLYRQGYTGYREVPPVFRWLSARPTRSWALRPALDLRIQEATDSIEQRVIPNAEFFATQAYRDVYKCSSCHSK